MARVENTRAKMRGSIVINATGYIDNSHSGTAPTSTETCNQTISSCAACRLAPNTNNSDLDDRTDALSQIFKTNENVGEELTYSDKLKKAIEYMKNYDDDDALKFLVSAYYETSQFDKMNASLFLLSSDKNYTDFKNMYGILAKVKSEGRELNMLNNEELIQVRKCASNNGNEVKALAQNILFHYYDEYYPTLTVLPKTIDQGNMETAISNTIGLNIYPNPTEGNTVLSYQLTEINNNFLVISDVYGKIVISIKLSDKEGKINYNMSNLSSGLYFCTLKQNDIVIACSKFIKN